STIRASPRFQPVVSAGVAKQLAVVHRLWTANDLRDGCKPALVNRLLTSPVMIPAHVRRAFATVIGTNKRLHLRLSTKRHLKSFLRSTERPISEWRSPSLLG